MSAPGYPLERCVRRKKLVEDKVQRTSRCKLQSEHPDIYNMFVLMQPPSCFGVPLRISLSTAYLTLGLDNDLRPLSNHQCVCQLKKIAARNTEKHTCLTDQVGLLHQETATRQRVVIRTEKMIELQNEFVPAPEHNGADFINERRK